MTTFALSSREDTARFGTTLGALLRSGDVLALVGDLGAGKTTLTQAIARGMGITAPVTSPTFALIQEYPGPIPLFHFDTYRLDSPEDVYDLGFEEYFEREGVVVIEWADRITPLLPPDHLTLSLTIPLSRAQQAAPLQDGEGAENGVPRLLRISASGERSRQLRKELESGMGDLVQESDV